MNIPIAHPIGIRQHRHNYFLPGVANELSDSSNGAPTVSNPNLIVRACLLSPSNTITGGFSIRFLLGRSPGF